jgi:hypothetical protein
MAKGRTLFLWAAGVALPVLMCAVVVCSGAVVIYTKDNAPATPKLEDLPLKESVSQYGITWTFDKPARVGQFINGDWYVVGDVTIKMIDPKPLFGAEVKETLDRDWEGRERMRQAFVNRTPHYGNDDDAADESPGDGRRPYLGILFECCGVYARVYRQRNQMIYRGRCPKCLRMVRVRVGRDGTTARLFRAR